jgi:arginine/lysine/ornithine decarboxylase
MVPTMPEELVEPGWTKHAQITDRTTTEGAIMKLSSGAREATATSMASKTEGQAMHKASAKGSMASMMAGVSARPCATSSVGQARNALRTSSSSGGFLGSGLVDMATTKREQTRSDNTAKTQHSQVVWSQNETEILQKPHDDKRNMLAS